MVVFQSWTQKEERGRKEKLLKFFSYMKKVFEDLPYFTFSHLGHIILLEETSTKESSSKTSKELYYKMKYEEFHPNEILKVFNYVISSLQKTK